jgi:hypothetical protein
MEELGFSLGGKEAGKDSGRKVMEDAECDRGSEKNSVME